MATRSAIARTMLAVTLALMPATAASMLLRLCDCGCAREEKDEK